jgi:hypothetical protein
VAPNERPGREIEQSGYWKFDVDTSIVSIDSPLLLVKNNLAGKLRYRKLTNYFSTVTWPMSQATGVVRSTALR